MDELRKFLESQKDGKTYLEKLDAHLEGLANTAKADKATIKKLQDEAKADKAKLEQATSKIEKFADALGVSEDSETLDDDIASALKAKGGNGDALLQKKIDRLNKQIAEKTKELTAQLTAEREKRHKSVIESALLAELTAQNAVEPATLISMFRNDVKVGEDDTLTFGDDGKSVKDGVAAWLHDHPAFVSNKQKAGAGGGRHDSDNNTGDKFIDLAKSLGKAASTPKDDPAANYFK